MPLETVLHPTDFSSCARVACRQAADIARGFRAKILLLHKVVYPEPFAPRDLLEHLEDVKRFDDLMKEYMGAAEARAREQLTALARELERSGLDVETTLERSLSPADAILERASVFRPDLIVMGTHGRTGARKLFLGSVAEKVLRHAPANVMTVREDSELAPVTDGGIILVPVDFSDTSLRGLMLAREWSACAGGRLHVLHVVEPLHAPFHPGGFISRLEADPDLASRYRQTLQGMLGDARGEVDVVEGNVAASILDVRERTGAGLVIMGTRGLGGFQHLLHGSVAEKIARYCEVPVVTVK